MKAFFTQIKDLLNYGWDIGGWYLSVQMILFSVLVMIIALLLRRFIAGSLLSFFKNQGAIDEAGKRKIRSIINYIILLAATIGLLKILGLDYTFFNPSGESNGSGGSMEFKNISIKISTLCLAIIVFKLAQLADWIIARILLNRYYESRTEQLNESPNGKDDQTKTNKVIQYLLYIIATILILRGFSLDYDIMKLQGGGHLTVANILEALMTMLIAWLIIWVFVNVILQPYYKRQKIDVGNQYAVNQLLKYVVYVIAIVFALQNNLHFNLNILLGGAAALLVGIGLGLQQTFNDLISGIILLFERTLEVGDVVDVNGLVGTVTSIGIRTSVVRVRNNTSIVVPNSKFITENVMNWSHNEENQVRFHVAIGIAYGSDVELARKTLLQIAQDNPDVLQRPASFVRFVDFADSSLNFELHFWSRNYIRIEDVKSDLRFQIDAEFRRNDIEIPFPQRVIWSGNK